MRSSSNDSRAIGSVARVGAAALGLILVVAPLGAALAQEPLGDGRAETAIEGGAEKAAPDPETPPPGEGATPAPGNSDVGLDQLLRLPNSLDFKEERRGGGGASDWRRRFSESERAMRDARRKLDEAEAAMAEAGTAGGGQWQIAPPGQQANADTGPLSLKLREDLRRAREGVEEAERSHRALVVEADLAEVPLEWRQTSVR